MTNEVIKNIGAFQIDEKRFHFPCQITSTCQKCGKNVEIDFEDENAPTGINENGWFYGYCEDCDVNWKIPYRIDMSIVLLEE